MDFAFYSKLEKTGDMDIDSRLGALTLINKDLDEKVPEANEKLRLMRSLQLKAENIFKDSNHKDLYKEQSAQNENVIKQIEHDLKGLISRADVAVRSLKNELNDLGFHFKDKQISIDVNLHKFRHIDNETGFQTESGKFDADKFYQMIDGVVAKHQLIEQESENGKGHKDILDWCFFESKSQIDYDSNLTIAFSFSEINEEKISAFLIDLSQTINESYKSLRRVHLMSPECEYMFRDLSGSKDELVQKELDRFDETPCSANGKGAMNFYGNASVSLSKGNTLAEISKEFSKDKSPTGICENMSPHYVLEDSDIASAIKTFYTKAFGTNIDKKSYGRNPEGYEGISRLSALEFLAQNPGIEKESEILFQAKINEADSSLDISL